MYTNLPAPMPPGTSKVCTRDPLPPAPKLIPPEAAQPLGAVDKKILVQIS